MSLHTRSRASSRHPARSLLFICMATLLPISQAIADTDVAADGRETKDFDTVVVTAAGFEQKITAAPASISVVTGEELRTRPYMTLIDAVRDLEGVDVGETSDKTGQRTISMRGMGPEYTLILIDGKRQNNHGDIYPNAFGGNQFNHIPPLDTIERIEVIRGPASTLYGADALGGVINIITRPVSDRWSGSATITRNFQQDSSFGTDTTLDFSLTGPLMRDVLGLNLRGSRYERDASQPDYEVIHDPDGNPHERSLGFGAGGKTVDNTNESFGLTLRWKIGEYQDISFDYDTSRQTYDNNIFINNLGSISYPLGTVDNIESIWAAAPRVGYIGEQEFTRDNWSLTHNGSWEWGNSFISLARVETANNGRTMPFSVAERLSHRDIYCSNAEVCDSGPHAGLTREQRRALMEQTFLPRPRRNLESSQYTFDAKLDIPYEGHGGSHHFVLGTQYIDGELDDGVFGMEGGGDGAGVVQDHRMWSVFAEDNWSPTDPLTVTFGIRYDDHNMFGGHVSPRVYAVYDISPNWVVKGGVSSGYKTPRTTDLFDGITGYGGQGTNPWTGNPDLKPETSLNGEVALYWSSSSNDHNFNITWFRNDFEDKISSTTVSQTCEQTGGVRPCANLGAFHEVLGIGSFNQPVNIDEARVTGLEVAGRYRIAGPLSIRANYTWTDSEQLSGAQAGRPLTNSAKHMANASLEWQVTDRLSTQLMLEARSDRYRGVDAEGNHLYYKSYEVLHLGAQYRFNDAITVAARLNNLLNQDFTSFDSRFNQNPDGSYTLVAVDHFNNKDKARNLWLSLNASF